MQLVVSTVRFFKREERERFCNELKRAHRVLGNQRLISTFETLKMHSKVTLEDPNVVTTYEIVEDGK